MSGAPTTTARGRLFRLLGDGVPGRLIDRLVDFAPLRLSFFLWLCVYAAWGIFRVPKHSGLTQDWQFFEFLDEVARKTVLEYHQFPFWNPYWCGGVSHIGNPQTTFVSPTFPLVLLFGAGFGERLAILTVMVVACEGGYRLCRHLGMGAAGSLVGALCYPLFGRTLGWYTDGQVGAHGIILSTWVVYGWLRGLSQPRYLVLGAAFLAWILGFRGIQPGPLLALCLGLWALLLGRRRLLDAAPGTPPAARLRAALWPLCALAIVGLLAAGFIGVRMLPILETVLAHPRVFPETRSNNLTAAWVEILYMPPNTPRYGASGYAYVGRATYLLFLGALLFAAPRKRAAIPLLLAVFLMFLTLGMHGEYSPYYQLQQLPIYSGLRNPALYVYSGAMFVVLCGATTLDELDRWLRARRTRPVRALASLLPLVGLLTGIEQARLIHEFMDKPIFTVEPTPRVAQEFKQARGNHFVAPVWPRLDRGSLDCYDETPWPASTLLRPDAPAEEYLGDGMSGTAQRIAWSPNRLEVQVDIPKPNTLLVNQNWAEGWRSSVGTARSEQGLVAVDLPAGSHRVVLTMRPPLALWGAALMVLALCAAALLVRWDLRRERARPDPLAEAPQ